MRTGKLPPDILEKLVFPYLGMRRKDVLVHAALGEDSAVIDFGDSVCVVSTDPITGATKRSGWLAVHISCNDVAANGATPLGVLPTLLLTEESTEDEVRGIMEEVHQAALELGVEVLGGHTEVTPGLPMTIISLAAIGRAPKERFVTSAGAQPGDDLLITKSAAIEGTAILAIDYGDMLLRTLDLATVQRAQALIRQISVVPEGIKAAACGVSAMHDVTEGGVIGGLFELAEASGVGLEVWLERIPIRPETEAICALFGADPLRLISSGAMLITARDGQRIKGALEEQGIAASLIGRVTEGERLLYREGVGIPLVPCERDELWRILEKIK
ncbi:MAG: AIR synthase family protein [Chloroflexi bacterium]|nr:AIR synthase family protein [Chloroflexota bacterium]